MDVAFKQSIFEIVIVQRCLRWRVQMAIIISVFLVHSHAISGISSIRASGDISGVSITTVTGTMSSTSCNIQTTNGTVSVKNGLFQNQSCTGTSRQTTTPTVVGVCTCMDSITACGIDISCTQLQYIFNDVTDFCLV